jgi:hypothetical protein
MCATCPGDLILIGLIILIMLGKGYKLWNSSLQTGNIIYPFKIQLPLYVNHDFCEVWSELASEG